MVKLLFAAGTTAMRVRLDNLKLEVMLLLLHPRLGMLFLNLDLQGQLLRERTGIGFAKTRSRSAAFAFASSIGYDGTKLL